MKERDENMEMKEDGKNEGSTWVGTDLWRRPGDAGLFREIGDQLRGKADIDDVKNDPQYNEISNITAKIVSESGSTGMKNSADKRYITDSIAGKNDEENMEEELRSIRQEMQEKKIDRVAGEWVKEWTEKADKARPAGEKDRERKEFITSSLENRPRTSLINRRVLLRYILPAAAVLTGAVFILRSLSGTATPDRLYSDHYEPMSAISPVTRSLNDALTSDFTVAVEFYKKRDYRRAAVAFTDLLNADPENISSLFLLGMCQMGLENWGQAAETLQKVAGNDGIYDKEAEWYLGLANIKSGNIEKAKECFRSLAESPGFYRDDAARILRRLK